MKPQIELNALDGQDPSPHLEGVNTPKDTELRDAATREARLAAALRANLRRRKAAAVPRSARNPQEKTSA